MALLADRVEGLMLVKGRLRQDELEGIPRADLTRWLNGHRPVSAADLKKLATALDATMDYLAGSRTDYGSYGRAAAHMSFSLFDEDISVPIEQKQRCRRILDDEAAPKTLVGWRALARMIDMAIGPTPVKFEVVNGGR
jgi:transcriptional regulator with XRE-family HTH domain